MEGGEVIYGQWQPLTEEMRELIARNQASEGFHTRFACAGTNEIFKTDYRLSSVMVCFMPRVPSLTQAIASADQTTRSLVEMARERLAASDLYGAADILLGLSRHLAVPGDPEVDPSKVQEVD